MPDERVVAGAGRDRDAARVDRCPGRQLVELLDAGVEERPLVREERHPGQLGSLVAEDGQRSAERDSPVRVERLERREVGAADQRVDDAAERQPCTDRDLVAQPERRGGEGRVDEWCGRRGRSRRRPADRSRRGCPTSRRTVRCGRSTACRRSTGEPSGRPRNVGWSAPVIVKLGLNRAPEGRERRRRRVADDVRESPPVHDHRRRSASRTRSRRQPQRSGTHRSAAGRR